MKYYVCAVCSCFSSIHDTATFKCEHCGSEKSIELTYREYRGRGPRTEGVPEEKGCEIEL